LAIVLFLLAIAAFRKFAAKRTRHTIPVFRNGADDAAGTDILTHTLFHVNQTGAVTVDAWRGTPRRLRTAWNHCVVRVLYNSSRRARPV
jgi:hypothetical protein